MAGKKTNQKSRTNGPPRQIVKPKKGGKRGRGLLNHIGGMIAPGIGNAIGQFGDNLVMSAMGNALSNGKGVGIAGAGRTRSHQVNSTVQKGSEQLTSFTVPSGTRAGSVLLQALIAAPELGVRLRKMAELWTKTRFLKFVVEVVSANPSIVPGNYTLAIDPDPVQEYQSGDQVVERLMALTNSIQANAWNGSVLDMKANPISLFNRYDPSNASDAEIREYACGQLLFATTTNYDQECQYTVHIHWEVQFERPDTIHDDDSITGYQIGNLTGKHCDISAFSTGVRPLLKYEATGADPSIPPGDYTFITGGKLNFAVRLGGQDPPATFNADYMQVVVSAGVTSWIFACKPKGFTYNGSSSEIIVSQTPIFSVVIPYGGDSRKGFVNIGPVKMHRYFLTRKGCNVHSWLETCRKNREDSELEQLLKQELSKRRVAAISAKTDQEVAEELTNLRIRQF